MADVFTQSRVEVTLAYGIGVAVSAGAVLTAPLWLFPVLHPWFRRIEQKKKERRDQLHQMADAMQG